ncbi:CU044_5270 family protein [Streptomyces sp. CRN 30]|uniref:CU044_5270 family protein n=1 Tax=Streptomyces sp. CRN 30 TaxID=3075613 RepID=UPI002A81DF77|nr:CU044_5270 family protein [Streptomyces sp. CRN 30]
MKTSPKRSRRPDVLKILADARPDELDPARLTDPTRQRQDLARIIADTADDRAPRRGSGFRPLGAMVLAGVTASVVVAVGTFDAHAPADRSTAQPRSSAAQPRSSGAAQPSSAAPDVTTDGHLELLSAATRAAASPAAGTYWQTTTESQYVDVAEAGGQLFAVRTTSREQWSVGVRSGAGSLMVTGLDARTEPLTAADEARWRAAGSPRTAVVEAGQGTSAHRISVKAGTSDPMVMRTDIGGKIYAVGPDNVTYQDLRALPTTAAGLRRHLEELYARDNSADNGTERGTWMLRQAGSLVTMPVKPAVRAAAYRVMADLPGVRVVGGVTDPLGRVGVGVEYPETYEGPLGTTKQRLIVDPATGEMLGDQLLLVDPSARAEAAGLTADTSLSYQATTRMAWAEHQIDVPENAHS